MTDPVTTSAAPGVNCTRCGAVMLDLYRCPNCTPGNAAMPPWHFAIVAGLPSRTTWVSGTATLRITEANCNG